jgi:hypothetical protein
MGVDITPPRPHIVMKFRDAVDNWHGLASSPVDFLIGHFLGPGA